MQNLFRNGISWPLAIFMILAIYPLFPLFDDYFFHVFQRSLGDQLPTLFIYAILAFSLNLVVGNTGQLHLGIAAFFSLGAYVTGILTVSAYPFEIGIFGALIASILFGAFIGGLVTVPMLRLRGDYLALVTLGFGEVVRFTIRNLDSITAGTRTLNPVPPPVIPGLELDWFQDYRPFYYLTLTFLALTYLLLRSLEQSRLGRAWVAIREDELAAGCMGLNTNRLKLAAFVITSGIAAMAGCLYASRLTSTVGPDNYDFNRSVFILCCLILGGLGNMRGVFFGVVLLYGFDNIASPIIDDFIQQYRQEQGWDPPKTWQSFSGWRLMVFGLVMILVMRFRPEGLIPSNRVREEVHPERKAETAGGAV